MAWDEATGQGLLTPTMSGLLYLTNTSWLGGSWFEISI
jgi:hypothetical protein